VVKKQLSENRDKLASLDAQKTKLLAAIDKAGGHSNSNGSAAAAAAAAAGGKQLAKVLFDYEANSKTELTVAAGDVVTILNTDNDEWWEAELKGKVGFFPKTYCELLKDAGAGKKATLKDSKKSSADSSAAAAGAASAAGGAAAGDSERRAEVLFVYEARSESELSIKPGTTIKILSTSDEEWWQGERDDGETGYFPATYVKLIKGGGGGGDSAKSSRKGGASASLKTKKSEKVVTPAATSGSAIAGPKTAAPTAALSEKERASTAADDKKKRKKKKHPQAKVKHDYDAEGENELTIKQGWIIDVIAKTNDDWWEGRYKGQLGYFPRDYVEIIEEKATAAKGDDEPVQARVMFDYDASGATELTIATGQIVTIVDKTNDDWWEGEYDGKSGFFPKAYVELIDGSGDKKGSKESKDAKDASDKKRAKDKKEKDESDAAAKKADEEAAKKKADEDAAAKKKADEEAKKKADEEAAAAKKKADDEAAAKKKKADEDAAAAKKKADEDAAAAKKKVDEEAAAAKKKADEEAKKKAEEAEAKRLEERKKMDEAARKKADEEEAAKKKKAEAEAAAAKKKAEEDAAAAKKKADDEAAAAKKKADQEAAAAKKKADEEAAAAKKKVDEETAKKAAEAAEKAAAEEAAAARARTSGHVPAGGVRSSAHVPASGAKPEAPRGRPLPTPTAAPPVKGYFAAEAIRLEAKLKSAVREFVNDSVNERLEELEARNAELEEELRFLRAHQQSGDGGASAGALATSGGGTVPSTFARKPSRPSAPISRPPLAGDVGGDDVALAVRAEIVAFKSRLDECNKMLTTLPPGRTTSSMTAEERKRVDDASLLLNRVRREQPALLAYAKQRLEIDRQNVNDIETHMAKHIATVLELAKKLNPQIDTDQFKQKENFTEKKRFWEAIAEQGQTDPKQFTY
jgi:hypothetical protein